MLEEKLVKLKTHDSNDNPQKILELINSQKVLLNLTPTIPLPFTSTGQ